MRIVYLVCVVSDRCASIAKESTTRPTGRECEENLSIELLRLSLRSVLTYDSSFLYDPLLYSSILDKCFVSSIRSFDPFPPVCFRYFLCALRLHRHPVCPGFLSFFHSPFFVHSHLPQNAFIRTGAMISFYD